MLISPATRKRTEGRTMKRVQKDPQVSRREIVASLAACAAAAGLLPSIPSWAAAPAARAIDFHHHFNPPFLVAAAQANRVGADASGLNWDLGYSLEDMDKSGIATAGISPSTGFV